MCEFTEFNFVCGHVVYKLLSECHFTRTDPNKEHHGIKVIKESYAQSVPCPECEAKIRKAMEEKMKAEAAQIAQTAHHIPFGADGQPIPAGRQGQAGHQGHAGKH
jgi:hypothetical protein